MNKYETNILPGTHINCAPDVYYRINKSLSSLVFNITIVSHCGTEPMNISIGSTYKQLRKAVLKSDKHRVGSLSLARNNLKIGTESRVEARNGTVVGKINEKEIPVRQDRWADSNATCSRVSGSLTVVARLPVSSGPSPAMSGRDLYTAGYAVLYTNKPP